MAPEDTSLSEAGELDAGWSPGSGPTTSTRVPALAVCLKVLPPGSRGHGRWMVTPCGGRRGWGGYRGCREEKQKREGRLPQKLVLKEG